MRVPPTVQPFVLGSEIVSAGVPAPGRVRDAYTPTLPALLAALGARVERARLLPDDQQDLEAALAYSGAELLITTGSSSRGPTDRLRAALEATGCELVVDGVAMRPGHPVLLARRRDGRPVLGLPGNPFAGLVALLTLGVPLLDGMLGRPVPRPRTASAAEDIPNPRRGVRIVAARTGDAGVVAVDFQGPAMLRGLAAADVLAVIPEGGVRRSDEVLVLPLPW